MLFFQCMHHVNLNWTITYLYSYIFMIITTHNQNKRNISLPALHPLHSYTNLEIPPGTFTRNIRMWEFETHDFQSIIPRNLVSNPRGDNNTDILSWRGLPTRPYHRLLTWYDFSCKSEMAHYISYSAFSLRQLRLSLFKTWK